MNKRFLLKILALCLAVFTLTGLVFAEETEPAETETEVTRLPNECGEGITWEFSEGKLTVTGDGAMDDFAEKGAPWQEYQDEIREVNIQGKLTYIGAYAFKDCDSLLKVNFGSAVYEIGTEAFASCDGLETIRLPAGFKVFGEGSFMSCKGLKEIHCEGRFPSFRQNCLWDTYTKIYYPADNPWSTEYIQQLEEAFKGRVEFLASDGTDHYEPTEAATEPEETVPETTVPETTAPAETEPPVTEEPTEAPTQAPTEPEITETAEVTEPEETEPAAEEEEKGGIHIGFVIVLAVLAGLGLGALIFGRKKGKYAR